MKFLFDDGSFSFEALRAAGYATYGGAELGEVLVTCRQIPEGDEQAWSAQWAATAERVEAVGRAALAGGHRVSAREALLRASNYYRTADFYRREDPAHDPESARLAAASRDTFAAAAGLLDIPARPVRIPYEGTTLPGYLFLAGGPRGSGASEAARDSGGPGAARVSVGPRPTVVYHGGYDSTLEEGYLALAAGALRRGYHVLVFDGPGQGSVVRDQGLHFRPDWEAVVTPVVDFAAALPEVDEHRIALVGTSLGGYLAVRAAAFEHRLAACILHDGVYDVHEAFDRLSMGAAEAVTLDMVNEAGTQMRWAVWNGLWTFGVGSAAELVEAARPYTMAGIADQVRCPTLVLEAENDQFFKGQPQQIHQALTCPKEFLSFPEAEGGGEHCHEGAVALWHQRAFDWLDGVLAN